ncbi:MAG TPA: hypothetical protein DFI01_09595, partial [Bacteroidales bacterium]|nr:hypothetical protein [Bacteroidales bacterium]
FFILISNSREFALFSITSYIRGFAFSIYGKSPWIFQLYTNLNQKSFVVLLIYLLLRECHGLIYTL